MAGTVESMAEPTIALIEEANSTIEEHVEFNGGVTIGDGTDPEGQLLSIPDLNGTPRLKISSGDVDDGAYIGWEDADGSVRAIYRADHPEGYVTFKGSWVQLGIEASVGKGLAFGIFGGDLDFEDRPTIATQVGTVDVAAFNALRDALVAMGLVIDGD